MHFQNCPSLCYLLINAKPNKHVNFASKFSLTSVKSNLSLTVKLIVRHTLKLRSSTVCIRN